MSDLIGDLGDDSDNEEEKPFDGPVTNLLTKRGHVNIIQKQSRINEKKKPAKPKRKKLVRNLSVNEFSSEAF